jgi:hypothetical protein
MNAGLYALAFFLHQCFSSALARREGFAFDASLRWLQIIPAPALMGFYFATLGVLYWLYYRLARPEANAETTRFEKFIVGGLLALLWLTPPSRSTDIFAYLAHGHNSQADLSQSYAKPIYADESTYLNELRQRSGLVAHGPSPYGPWFTYLENITLKLAPVDTYGGTLLLKLAGIFAFLASAWVAQRLRPGAALLIFYNPFLLTELVAEGHNDVWVMLFGLLLAWALKSARIGPAIMAGTAGVLTKYVPALLAGPALSYAWRKKLVGRSVIPWLLFSGALVWLSFYPLWLGRDTFRGVQDNADALPAFLRGLKFFLRENPSVKAAAVGGLWLGFMGFWAYASARVKSFDDFILASAQIFLAYFLFFPPFVWAWYLALPVALLALLPRAPFRWMFSLALIGSLQGPLWAWKRAEIFSPDLGAFLHHAVLPGLGLVWFAAFLLSSRQGTFTRLKGD